jgi:hypothetical protein
MTTDTTARYEAALARYREDEAELIRDIDALEMRLAIVREYRQILEGIPPDRAPRATRKRRGQQRELQQGEIYAGAPLTDADVLVTEGAG